MTAALAAMVTVALAAVVYADSPNTDVAAVRAILVCVTATAAAMCFHDTARRAPRYRGWLTGATAGLLLGAAGVAAHIAFA